MGQRSTGAGRSDIVIPEHFEDRFLVRGPRLFELMIRECGGSSHAASTAPVAPSTMSRWCNSHPGAIFGPRKDTRSWRSMWFGYPSPFPGLDRIVEEIAGEEKSYLGLLIERLGMKGAVSRLRSDTGFGLIHVGLDGPIVTDACEIIGIPPVTRRRWRAGLAYPRQWRGLDHIVVHLVDRERRPCSHCGGVPGEAVSGRSWLEAVLRFEPLAMPRTSPPGAVRCLVGRTAVFG